MQFNCSICLLIYQPDWVDGEIEDGCDCEKAVFDFIHQIGTHFTDAIEWMCSFFRTIKEFGFIFPTRRQNYETIFF